MFYISKSKYCSYVDCPKKFWLNKYKPEVDSLELNTLFNVIDAKDAITGHYENVETNLKTAQAIIESDKEPEIPFHKKCKDCEYIDYCMRDISSPSVFDLYMAKGHNFSSLISLYNEGIVSFEDFKNSEKWNECHIIRKLQVEHYLNELGTYINKDIINDFLNKLSYPLYFLDFETMNPAIPEYEGSAPYQQIPFQYSLHYINNEGGELLHKEFLSESGIDPRRGVAEALCMDIQKDACIIVYNKSFERTVLKNLAEFFPDLSDYLLNIRDHIVDLYEPFSEGGCYNKAMGKSFSIKSVLPALYPDDPTCDYHNLDGVQNGGDAMTIFPKLKNMSPEEQEKTRKALLKYCELDTLATVKVLEKLQELVK